MSNAGKVVRGTVVLAVAAAGGTLIGWLVSRQGDIKPITVPPALSQSLAVAPAAVESRPPTKPVPKPQSRLTNPSSPKTTPQPGSSANWEQRLDDILLGDDDENGKADKILAMIPNAPPEARQELAQHLVNMVQDNHYDGTAEMLTNSSTPVDVSDVLMNDLLNRNNTLKLPMLLSVARNETHPLKDQALDLLGLLTQEDNGTNWDQWSTTIDTWLQNNPQ